MTASGIIHEIEMLPASDQEKVVRFAMRPGFRRRLSPGELGSLATRLTATDDPVESAVLQEEIVQGFYGNPAHA